MWAPMLRTHLAQYRYSGEGRNPGSSRPPQMKPQNASATAKSTTLRDQFLKRLPYEIYHYRPQPYPISCGLLLLTHKIPPADTSCCEACGGYRHLRYNQVARRCNFRLEILYPCTKGGSIDNREDINGHGGWKNWLPACAYFIPYSMT